MKPLTVCTPKSLPDDLLVAAALSAVEINPANRPAVEMMPLLATCLVDGTVRPEHLAVLTTKWWGQGGVKLSVSFLDNPPSALRSKILAYANKWGDAANVTFAESSQGDVRVSRGPGGYYSYLGTDCRMVPANRQTMNLQGFSQNTPDGEFDRVVCHEFGHAIGCPHEHARQAIVNRLDPAKVISYFMRTQGWSEQVVRQQILTPLEEGSLFGSSAADETSVMTYQFPGAVTKDGRAIAGGSGINDADRAVIAKVYPKAASEVTVLVPRAGTYVLRA